MLPQVSIIVPCYNEQETIGFLLGAILNQTYPRGQMEVVIADGLSQDKTRDVIEDFGQAHPDLALRVVDNGARTIPSSLNLAIRAARGELIVRLDAHSIPFHDYVSKCVQAIQDGKGGNVGGKWIIRAGGTSWTAKSIAAAAGHPLGAGDAWYRIGGTARQVDTVPFGAFARGLFESVGGFDEKLLTNEDYEFNARLRRSGVTIWFDPEIRSTYLARASLRELARQYWRYGFWKVRMLMRFPNSLRWRQALPPLFVSSLGLLFLLSALWRPALIALSCEIVLYILALIAAGIDMAMQGREWPLLPGSVLALATMHLAWGSGFLWSLARAGRSERNG
jgi:cellulose synthase/poly-beta-1,6-N-acetylglucosamine synthase-like glycosyltransferase